MNLIFYETIFAAQHLANQSRETLQKCAQSFGFRKTKNVKELREVLMQFPINGILKTQSYLKSDCERITKKYVVSHRYKTNNTELQRITK